MTRYFIRIRRAAFVCRTEKGRDTMNIETSLCDTCSRPIDPDEIPLCKMCGWRDKTVEEKVACFEKTIEEAHESNDFYLSGYVDAEELEAAVGLIEELQLSLATLLRSTAPPGRCAPWQIQGKVSPSHPTNPKACSGCRIGSCPG